MSVPRKNGFPAFLRRTANFPRWNPCGHLKSCCVERRKYRDLYGKRPKNDHKTDES